jgi:hypothetical protein
VSEISIALDSVAVAGYRSTHVFSLIQRGQDILAMRLVSHASVPVSADIQIECRWTLSPSEVALDYALLGAIDALRIPPLMPLQRRDGLWRTTCFEWFVMDGLGPGYLEFNFTPDAWQIYRFTDYRIGAQPLPVVTPPRISAKVSPQKYQLQISLDRALLSTVPTNANPSRRMAFSVVVEDDAGNRSYWALKHAAAKPDFHHPDGFIAVGEI